MAGWITMKVNLAESAEVELISHATKLDVFAVVGRLQVLWSWVFKHTQNGESIMDAAAIDRRMGCDGFADAMIRVGWLRVTDTGTLFVGWDKNNTTDKSLRDAASERQRVSRERRNGPPPPVTECHNVSQNVTRDICVNTNTKTNQTTTTTKLKPVATNAGGGGGGVEFSARFSLLQKRPPWLPSAHEWIGKPKARELARSRLTGDDFGEIYDDIQRRVNGMKNPAGVFISMCEQRIKEADDGSRTLPVVHEGGEVANARGGAA